MTKISPQPGPQTKFLSCSTDVAIFGGAAGGGKSFGLLLDAAGSAMRYNGFGAVIFRRTGNQVMSEGGLWDKSEELYPVIGGIGTRHDKTWRFKAKGSAISFAHLEHDKDRFTWQGAEIAYVGFDELTHFTENQFWYLLGRNRSMCGSKPMMRATTNPDPDHFAADLVAWYIDQDSGYAIPERSGVIRWFVRIGDDLHWGHSKDELTILYGPEIAKYAKSFTFIRSMIEDNPILLEKNPEYLASLMALNTVDRERLRFGNWKVRATAGMYYQAPWFKLVDEYPRGYRMVRYWDRAATEKTALNDPDWTVGLKMMRDPQGIFYILDVIRARLRPLGVEDLIRQTAELDGPDTDIILEKDPAQAGVMEIDYLMRRLAGYPVFQMPKTVNTELLCRGSTSQCQAGNMRMLRGEWNQPFISEMVNFPNGSKDDQVTGFVGAFNYITLGPVALTESNFTMGHRQGIGLTKQIFKPHAVFGNGH